MGGGGGEVREVDRQKTPKNQPCRAVLTVFREGDAVRQPAARDAVPPAGTGPAVHPAVHATEQRPL